MICGSLGRLDGGLPLQGPGAADHLLVVEVCGPGVLSGNAAVVAGFLRVDIGPGYSFSNGLGFLLPDYLVLLLLGQSAVSPSEDSVLDGERGSSVGDPQMMDGFMHDAVRGGAVFQYNLRNGDSALSPEIVSGASFQMRLHGDHERSPLRHPLQFLGSEAFRQNLLDAVGLLPV